MLSVWRALRSGLPGCAGAALLPYWLCSASVGAVGGFSSAAAWPAGCSVGWVSTKRGEQPGFRVPATAAGRGWCTPCPFCDPQLILTFEDAGPLTSCNRDQVLTCGSNSVPSTSCLVLRIWLHPEGMDGSSWRTCKIKKILGDISAYHSDNLPIFGHMYNVHVLLISSFFYSINAFWFPTTCHSSVLGSVPKDPESMVWVLEKWGGSWKWYIKLLFQVCLEALNYFVLIFEVFLSMFLDRQKRQFWGIGRKSKRDTLDTYINEGCMV